VTGCNLNCFEGCALFRLLKVRVGKYMSSTTIGGQITLGSKKEGG
jgi:hypothetical protein